MADIKTEEAAAPLPQRAPNQSHPGNAGGNAGSQQVEGSGPQMDRKPMRNQFHQGGISGGLKGNRGNRGGGGNRGGNRFGGGGLNRQNRPNQQHHDGMKNESRDMDERMPMQNNSGGGGGGGRGGGGGGFQRGKNEDFMIQQKLRNLSGPLLDIPPVEQEEMKFSGRNRLYIGNLTNDITEPELKEIFAPYGEIGEVFLNPEKNFAFIKVDYHVNAEKAKRDLDGTIRKGKQMRIRFAPNGTIVKVKNLASYVSNELLYRSFEVFGQVERAVVIVDDRGKPTGEGIIEYARKASAMAAIRLCSDRCYFLTSSLRPVVLEIMEHMDESDGYPEKSINKKMNDFVQSRQMGPRFAEPGSFEHEYGSRWKQLYEMFKQKKESLKRELAMEENKLEAQMEFARYEHETEMLREQLRMREQDRDRQKKEWEIKERHAEEMRSREVEQMRQHQDDIQMRMMRQEEDMRKRQQENTLFMQAQQLNSLLDQQERKNFDDRRGGGGGFKMPGGGDMNQMNQMNDAGMDDHFNRQQQSRFDDKAGPGGGANGGGPRGNQRPWDRREDNFQNKRRRF